MRNLFYPPAVFLVAALAAGVPLVYLTPPFQVPDEPAHFLRAYAISEGKLSAINRDGATGHFLPASLQRMINLAIGELPFDPGKKLDHRILLETRRIELEPEQRAFLYFPATAMYSPLPYLAPALGLLLGRLAGVSPLELVYLGRLTNLLSVCALLYLAIRQLPALRWLGAVLALAPTAIFLRSSLSADAFTFAVAFLVSASTARLAFTDSPASRRRDVGLLGIASAALCLTKLPYALLLLGALAITAVPRPGWARGKALSGVLAASLLAFGLAVAIAARVEAPLRRGAQIDPRAQIAGALADPPRFLGLVAADYAVHLPRYTVELVGVLGWLDTPVPLAFTLAYLATLLVLLALDTDRRVHVAPRQRLVVGAAVGITLIAISASVYATWTPVGAARIEGLQGRYFLAVAASAIWALYHERWAGRAPRWLLPGLGWAAAVAAVGVTLVTVHQRYYPV